MASYVNLDDIINDNNRYDINDITFFTMTDDGELVIRDTDLFVIYRRYINPYIAKYNVSVEQRRKYKCKPELLSSDVYGTPALAWLILLLNDQECPSKFYIKSTIKLIPYDYLQEMYDTVVTRSSSRLNENWNEYLPKVDSIYQ
jgi:hypothetical protein